MEALVSPKDEESERVGEMKSENITMPELIKDSPDQGSLNCSNGANWPPNKPVAQLTIFYGGSVSVYDAVPPEKAQALMFIAAAAAAAVSAACGNNKSNNNSQQPTISSGPNNAALAGPVLARCLSFQSSSTAAGAASPQPRLIPDPNSSLCKMQAELPIARRHSLKRFLETRRDRLVSKAPYTLANTTSDSTQTTLKAKPELC